MSTIRDLTVNPSKINTTTLNTVNHNYQAALHQSQIVIEDDMLIFREPVSGGSSYTHPPTTGPGRILQYHLCGISLQRDWRTSQCLPYTTPYSSTLLLARDVLVYQAHVQCLSRLRSGKPYQKQVVRTRVQLPHQGALSSPFHRCLFCGEAF